MPRLSLAAIAAAAVLPAMAHHPAGVEAAALASRWTFDPWVTLPLAASLALYVVGLRRLWARAGRGRGISGREAACFAAGWLVLAASLVSPIDALGGALFSMHMVQHELMMVVAAPFFVLSRPVEAWTWAMSPSWRRSAGRITRGRFFAAAWRTLTEPRGAWIFHAVAIWAWHIPPLFEAALANEGVHALQHATFLASALAFWASVITPATRRGDAVALASLFTTMLHTGALGALLTFAPSAWYAHYLDAAAFGLTPLEDQQLGGLVMWVPGGLAYVIAGLVLVGSWLSPRRAGALR
ncbi:MAG TPA: cytochrome c oxidase assembly protein [Usitatibacter sp.]|nr:cytochrome c oxidase assembly protein [Usitatibacter sp.]